MSRALFIVFEGIDGSGTTTQSHLLARHIKSLGCSVVLTREPGGTPLAEGVRRLVLETRVEEVNPTAELFLYAAGRAQHVRELIQPALREGKPVVCDRFTASTVAYQGYGRGLDLEEVERVNRIAVGACRPDLTIYLEVSISEALRRRRRRGTPPDRLERAGDEFQQRVARAYRQMALRDPDASLLVGAARSPEQIGREIREKLHKRWPLFPFEASRQEAASTTVPEEGRISTKGFL